MQFVILRLFVFLLRPVNRTAVFLSPFPKSLWRGVINNHSIPAGRGRHSTWSRCHSERYYVLFIYLFSFLIALMILYFEHLLYIV